MTSHDDYTDNTNLTPAELANRWRTSEGHLGNLRSNRTGPPFWKFNAKVLYRLVDIFEYEAGARVETSAVPA